MNGRLTAVLIASVCTACGRTGLLDDWAALVSTIPALISPAACRVDENILVMAGDSFIYNGPPQHLHGVDAHVRVERAVNGHVGQLHIGREAARECRLDVASRDEAQIDFGEMGYVADDEGRRRELSVLIVTLSMSRYMFVWPTFVQTCATLIDGLEAA